MAFYLNPNSKPPGSMTEWVPWTHFAIPKRLGNCMNSGKIAIHLKEVQSEKSSTRYEEKVREGNTRS